MKDESLKEIIFKHFGVRFPISGGYGSSINDPIIIDAKNTSEGVSIEYAVLKYIMFPEKWKVEKQELLNEKGRRYDKLSVVLSDDPDNYHNYYFDITSFYSKNFSS